MSEFLPRRRLLTGGVAMAATAVLAAPAWSGANSTKTASDPTAPVVVRWDGKRRGWAHRPSEADFGVVFLSTNDPRATAPTASNVQAGDVWRRHPDAVEA